MKKYNLNTHVFRLDNEETATSEFESDVTTPSTGATDTIAEEEEEDQEHSTPGSHPSPQTSSHHFTSPKPDVCGKLFEGYILFQPK